MDKEQINRIVFYEIDKVLKLLQDVDFQFKDEYERKANQYKVNQAYSKLFDLYSFLKIVEGKENDRNGT